MWIAETESSSHKVAAARIEVTRREFKESSSLEIENEWCLRDLCIKLITGSEARYRAAPTLSALLKLAAVTIRHSGADD